MAFSSEDYIAVFDSGVGGISVLRHLKKQMPGENFLYYGDCANAPYGNRPTEQVRALTDSVVEKILKEYPVKALVVACNTATSAAIGFLREKYPRLIIVGIEPALKLAADSFPGGNIGVMATDVTLREEKFDLLLQRWSARCRVHKIHAPGLVELVEQGQGNTRAAEELLFPILEPYQNQLDALVLGCTHYPFAAGAIRKILGNKTALLDGGDGTARETLHRLQNAQLLAKPGSIGSVIFKTSGNAEKFTELSRHLLEMQEV